MEYTPAPWTTEVFTKTSTRLDVSIISSSEGWAEGGRTVAEVGHWTDRPNPEADAQLITAAPELLKALLYVVKYHRENDSGEGELFGLDYVTTAIAAIAKATQ